MKKLIVGLVCLFSVGTASAIDTFVEADHYSKPFDVDYGLTMVNVGAEQCFQERLCVTGKLGTPVGYNDMGNEGRYWDNGDLVANVGVRLYITKSSQAVPYDTSVVALNYK